MNSTTITIIIIIISGLGLICSVIGLIKENKNKKKHTENVIDLLDDKKTENNINNNEPIKNQKKDKTIKIKNEKIKKDKTKILNIICKYIMINCILIYSIINTILLNILALPINIFLVIILFISINTYLITKDLRSRN